MYRALIGDAFQARQHEEKRTHVGRLFLHPHNISRCTMTLQFRVQFCLRERVQLLEENNGGAEVLVFVFVFALLPLRAQFVPDLPGADQNPLGILRFRVRRSMLFGVNTTSGFLQWRSACRRSRWKYWPAFEG